MRVSLPVSSRVLRPSSVSLSAVSRTSFPRPNLHPSSPFAPSFSTQIQTRSYAAKPSLDSSAAAGGPQAPAEYCAALVRRLDPEAWLCSYFWPRRERDWWLAWRAFNLELHLISTTITQPALAAIRFQFWRDALSNIFASGSSQASSNNGVDGVSRIPQHPVAVALAEVRRSRPVQKYYLSQMIDIRAKTLSLPPSSPTLESHLSTYSPLASALLLGPLPLLLPSSDPGTSHISHTLSHLSHLLTTVSLLRSLPPLVAKRQSNIPSDVAAAHGVVEEDLFRNYGAAKGIKDACLQIGTRGMDELITARRDLKGTEGKVVPEQAMPLFLAAVPAEQWLKRLEKVDFDVFHPDLQKHDWRLAPTIWWQYRSGKL